MRPEEFRSDPVLASKSRVSHPSGGESCPAHPRLVEVGASPGALLALRRRPSRAVGWSWAILILVLTSTAWARPQVESDEPIDIDLVDASLIQVLSSFASIGAAELEADPTVEGEVTVHLKKVSWLEALDKICLEHRLHCVWQSGDPPKLKVRPAKGDYAGFPENISLSLAGASRNAVLSSFTNVTNSGVELEGTFWGTVDLELSDVPWTEGLLQVCSDGGCRVDFSTRPVQVRAVAPPEPPSPPSPPSAPTAAPPSAPSSPTTLPSPPRPPGAPAAMPSVPSPPTPPLPPLALSSGPDVQAWPVYFEWSSATGKHSGGSAAGTVRFSWAGPVHRVEVADGTWLALTWLPLSPGRQALLPLLYRCDSSASGASFSKPVPLPLASTQRIDMGDGATLILAPPSGGTSDRANARQIPCALDGVDLLVQLDRQVTGQELEGNEAHRASASYRVEGESLGEFVLLSTGTAGAFVVGGIDAQGRLLVAQVRDSGPTGSPEPLELSFHRLALGESIGMQGKTPTEGARVRITAAQPA